MASTPCLIRVAAALAAATLVAPACGQGSGAKPPYTVTSAVVSHPTTQEIRVYAPEAKGSWPVVLALHGVGGSGQDMGELGTRLARQGTVVFAPTYRTDLSTEDGFVQAARDDECAYRYASQHRRPARRGSDPAGDVRRLVPGRVVRRCRRSHRADRPHRPVPELLRRGPSGRCDRRHLRLLLRVPGEQGHDAGLRHLAVGEQGRRHIPRSPATRTPRVRPGSRSKRQRCCASAGYRVHLTHLPGATHYAPVFHDLRNGQWVVVADDPAGERTVSVILDAIAASRPQANADAVSSLSSDPR